VVQGQAEKMQRYGRQRQHPGNLPDNHPQKGRDNWWEVEFHDGNKKRARQQARIEVEEGIAMTETKSVALRDSITIEVRQQDWVPGFAAFGEGSVNHDGHAHVVLNIGGLMSVVADKKIAAADLPYMVAECLMHEVVHALEEWAEVEFSEERVEALIKKYRETIGLGGPAGEDGKDPFEEAVEEMDKSVACLYVVLPEDIADNVKSRWQAVKTMIGC